MHPKRVSRPVHRFKSPLERRFQLKGANSREGTLYFPYFFHFLPPLNRTAAQKSFFSTSALMCNKLITVIGSFFSPSTESCRTSIEIVTEFLILTRFILWAALARVFLQKAFF